MRQFTIGILGLGLFGTSVARTLAENNVDVIAIDKNMDHVEEIIDEVGLAVQGDFTRLEQLSDAGMSECDEVIIAAAEKLEDSILAIINLRKLGIKKITAKTKNVEYQEVLLKVGATRVILPEVEMGRQIGLMIANPSVHELMQLDNQYNIIEFPYKKNWVGQTIESIDFRENFDANIIAIKHEGADHFSIEFGPDYIVRTDDIFIGVTSDQGMKKLTLL